MARNDPDGQHGGGAFSNLEADTFRDRSASIERAYKQRVRQGLLALANANLSRLAVQRQATGQRGAADAATGASGLQGLGARSRAARANQAASGREADASHRLSTLATRQQLDADRAERDQAHAVNLRDLMARRYS